jgi:hypothetical protein
MCNAFIMMTTIFAEPANFDPILNHGNSNNPNIILLCIILKYNTFVYSTIDKSSYFVYVNKKTAY